MSNFYPVFLLVGSAALATACDNLSVPTNVAPAPPQSASPKATTSTKQPAAKPKSTKGAATIGSALAPRDRNTTKPKMIGALAQDTYIRAAPSHRSREIGALDIGGAAVLHKAEPVSKAGCPGGWYAVEPQGFICHKQTTTLEPDNHPLVAAKRKHAGRFHQNAPYAWGESRFAPIYRNIPNKHEQKRWEGGLEKHLKRLNKLRDARRAGASEDQVKTPASLKGVDIFPAKDPPPAFLSNQRTSPWSVVHTPNDHRARYKTVPTRSTIAWTDEFFAQGRSWLLTPQLLIVPKDKIALQKPSPFKGVRLGQGQQLPIAFIKSKPSTKYRLQESEKRSEVQSEQEVLPASWKTGADFQQNSDNSRARFIATNKKWKRLEWVALTGRARWKRGKRYLETKDQGYWIREKQAVVFRGREPKGINLKEGEKWIDISIYRGSLVAYEGKTPVFATLISPGLKGYRRVKGKPAKYTTPPGTYRIEWKHITQTMSPDPKKKSYYLSEVPFTQFFHMPFALHGVYWHDRFGEPKSGGCVNLSVADARWLFEWTEPSLPEGWHSIRSGDSRGNGTWVVIR